MKSQAAVCIQVFSYCGVHVTNCSRTVYALVQRLFRQKLKKRQDVSGKKYDFELPHDPTHLRNAPGSLTRCSNLSESNLLTTADPILGITIDAITAPSQPLLLYLLPNQCFSAANSAHVRTIQLLTHLFRQLDQVQKGAQLSTAVPERQRGTRSRSPHHSIYQERAARLASNSHVSAIGLAAEADLKVSAECVHH